jgi:hypothetical protein
MLLMKKPFEIHGIQTGGQDLDRHHAIQLDLATPIDRTGAALPDVFHILKPTEPSSAPRSGDKPR